MRHFSWPAAHRAGVLALAIVMGCVCQAVRAQDSAPPKPVADSAPAPSAPTADDKAAEPAKPAASATGDSDKSTEKSPSQTSPTEAKPEPVAESRREEPRREDARRDFGRRDSGRGEPPQRLESTGPSPDGKVRFNFRFQPWDEVLRWFAQQADLSLVMDHAPAGTFNYTDAHHYTPAEAIDLLNGVLLTKGYTLVRRDRLLMVINLEDGIPPNLVPAVALEQLDTRGEFELVSVLFPLGKLSPDDAESEISRLLGPQGTIVKLPKARQIQVTEAAGRLRRIRDVLEVADGAGGGLSSALQLEVYAVPSADPQSVLDVLNKLLGSQTGGSLQIEPRTGNLVALARPDQHATIRATLAQLGKESRQIDVIRLVRVDPQLALAAINRLFDSQNASSTNAPKVDADLDSRQLLVRASAPQLAQIRELLVRLGEPRPSADGTTPRGNVRMLPFTGNAAQAALEQAERMWPTMRRNKIRIVTPSAVAPTLRSSGNAIAPTTAGEERKPAPATSRGASPTKGARAPATQRPEPAAEDRTAQSAPPRTRFLLAVDTNETALAEAAPLDSSEQEQAPAGVEVAHPPAEAAEAEADTKELPPVIVAPGPGGIMIASEDPAALDEFEALLRDLTPRRSASGREYTVFYLKSAPAATVAETLGQILGGSSSSSRGGGGNSLLGNMASAAIGEGPAEFIGGMMGFGRGRDRDNDEQQTVVTAGAVRIVPDARLNALLVQAPQSDLDTIEQLLQVLDQEETPDTLVALKPRMIPVVNSKAADIAEVVKQVYAERMTGAAGGGGGGGRPPGPEEFLRAFRGGGRDRGGSNNRAAEAQKISIGVDNRTNSLVVSAPQPTFEEIEQLVRTLDEASNPASESVRVVTLKQTNPQAVTQALAGLLGSNVQTSRTTDSRDNARGRDGDRSNEDIERMRRRMEFFNNMQRFGGGGFGGGGFGGREGEGGRGGFGGFGGGDGGRGFRGGGRGDRGGGDRGGGDRGR